MAGTTFTYEMESEIRGFHVYGKAWRPTIGDLLSTDRELANEDDKFAVGVYRTNHNKNELVGHLPAEFSCIAPYFIQNSGNFLQSDWEKGSLKRASRRTGYSMQATVDFIEQEACLKAE